MDHSTDHIINVNLTVLISSLYTVVYCNLRHYFNQKARTAFHKYTRLRKGTHDEKEYHLLKRTDPYHSSMSASSIVTPWLCATTFRQSTSFPHANCTMWNVNLLTLSLPMPTLLECHVVCGKSVCRKIKSPIYGTKIKHKKYSKVLLSRMAVNFELLHSERRFRLNLESIIRKVRIARLLKYEQNVLKVLRILEVSKAYNFETVVVVALSLA